MKRCVLRIQSDPAKAAKVSEPYAVCRSAIQGEAGEFEAAMAATAFSNDEKNEFRAFIDGLRKEGGDEGAETVQTQAKATILVFQESPRAGEGFKAAAGSDRGKNLFWKEVFRAGKYAHPQDQSVTMDVDEDRMRGWVKNFRDGVMQKVMATYVHPEDGKELIENAHGEVLDLKIEGSGRDASLLALVSLDDEAAGKVRAGLLYGVSVGLMSRLDKEGREVGEFLHHLALTNDPYLNDLDEFEIAASADGKRESAHFERMVLMENDGGKERLQKMGHRCLGDAYRGFRAMEDKAMMDAAEEEIERRYRAAKPGHDYPGCEMACMELAAMEGPYMDQDKTKTETTNAAANQDKITAEFEAVRGENKSLKDSLAKFEAELAVMRASNDKLREDAQHQSERALDARVEGWTKARFALSPAEAPRVRAILAEASKLDGKIQFEAPDKTKKESTASELLCSFLDHVTQHGLMDTRRTAVSNGSQVVTQGHDGQDAEEKDARTLINEFCAAKGHKPFDFSNGRLSADESARFKRVSSEAVRLGAVKYAPARPINQ